MPPESARAAETRPWFTKAAHDLRAAEVLLEAGGPRLIRRRETFEDLTSCEL